MEKNYLFVINEIICFGVEKIDNGKVFFCDVKKFVWFFSVFFCFLRMCKYFVKFMTHGIAEKMEYSFNVSVHKFQSSLSYLRVIRLFSFRLSCKFMGISKED